MFFGTNLDFSSWTRRQPWKWAIKTPRAANLTCRCRIWLTVTEFLLLQALAQRPGFVKSRDQLMDVAYDDQVYVDDRTIDSHIKRLRKKMRNTDGDFSAIETLYGIGYRYNEE